MPRRAATTSALALAVLAACAPTGEPPGEGWEPSPFGWRRRVADGGEGSSPRQHPDSAPRGSGVADLGDTSCGAIATEPRGPWQREGVRLRAVREGWHPRAEYGQPVAVREARPPFEVAGHAFFEVQVEGAPRAIQPCFVRESEGGSSFPTCAPAWVLVVESTPEARPSTNEEWAQLLGLLDGAAAVYASDAELDRCAVGLPEAVRAELPRLGLRRSRGEQTARFVERVDFGEGLTMLVAVHATLHEGRLVVAHDELWTLDREVER